MRKATAANCQNFVSCLKILMKTPAEHADSLPLPVGIVIVYEKIEVTSKI